MQKKTPRITAKLDPKSIFNHRKLNIKVIPLKVKQETLNILSDLKQLWMYPRDMVFKTPEASSVVPHVTILSFTHMHIQTYIYAHSHTHPSTDTHTTIYVYDHTHTSHTYIQSLTHTHIHINPHPPKHSHVRTHTFHTFTYSLLTGTLTHTSPTNTYLRRDTEYVEPS